LASLRLLTPGLVLGLAALLACGSGEGGLSNPRDVLPLARLDASGVQPRQGVPWAREAEDGPGTVRDGALETGWKAPVGEASWLEVDLLPLAGRPFTLDALEAHATGAAQGVTVDLAQACGSAPTLTVAWPDPAVALPLKSAAGCLTLRLTAAEGFSLDELHLYTREAALDWRGPPMLVAAQGQPAAPTWGVIEGFYGTPWSWDERARMVATVAQAGMGAYLYCPKDDPLHRDRWREPYPVEFVQRWAGLNAQAQDAGVALVFGISPFIDYDFDSEVDYSTLLDKCRAFVASGADGVALLADDIEFEGEVQVDGALGARHVALANRLLADLRAQRPDLGFWFCPTAYSDERVDQDFAEGGLEYLEALAGLDQAAQVLWTGSGTSSATMDAADLARVTQVTGRKPLIWDNFWANDGGDGFAGRVLLAPLTGRSADLPAAVGGIAHNPSIQGSFARLTLASFGSWRADPQGYTPEQGLEAAVQAERAFARGFSVNAERDDALVQRLMRLFPGNAQEIPRFAALDQAVAALLADLGGGEATRTAMDALGRVLAGMVTLDAEMHHSGLAPDLVDDAAAPLEKARVEGREGLLALAALGERLAGRDGAAHLAEAHAMQAASARNRFILSPGTVKGLLAAAEALPQADVGFRAPEAVGEPPACTAGTAFTWEPFGATGELFVSGLPGATVKAGTLTWYAPHPGRWRVVVTVVTAAGWAFREGEVACALP
jgi:hyaluronoglucosaminidase